MKKHHATYSYAGILAAVSMLLASSAFGSVVNTTLSSTGTYTADSAGTVGGLQNSSGFIQNSFAASFVAATNGDLSSIEVGVTGGGLGNFDNNFTVSLLASDLSTVLATSPVLTATVIFQHTNSLLETFTYTGPTVSLTAGTTYYVEVSPGNIATSLVEWNFSSISSSSQIFEFAGNGPWQQIQIPDSLAFEVDATSQAPSTPEPTTALFGAALTGVCAVARRRK
jgi:hypothetical protein